MAHQLQRSLRTFILILALHGLALAQTDAPITGKWTMGTLAGDQVLLNIQRMTVNSKMNNVSPVNLSRIRGLSRAQFDSPGSVRFELVRDAAPSGSMARSAAQPPLL